MYDVVIHYVSGKADHIYALQDVQATEEELMLIHENPDSGEITKEYIRNATIDSDSVTHHVAIKRRVR